MPLDEQEQQRFQDLTHRVHCLERDYRDDLKNKRGATEVHRILIDKVVELTTQLQEERACRNEDELRDARKAEALQKFYSLRNTIVNSVIHPAMFQTLDELHVLIEKL